ncbi:MAG: mechanosensitive ion channel family protein [Acidobacteriota bacterium]|nr:mechanosensitive ion channel family protein [Acidobacteriota bacterium]
MAPLEHSATNSPREWVEGVVAGLAAITAVVLGSHFGRFRPHASYSHYVEFACVVALLVTGAWAIRRLGAAMSRLLTRRGNPGAGGALRLVVNGLGLVILLFAAFAVLGASLGRLLIGAGLTGVILGIAAQQSLSNIFAAVVLLFARPFSVGDDIRIRSGTLGVIDVHVLGSGLTYVTVITEDGVIKIPNSVMLASGIGHLRADTAGAPHHSRTETVAESEPEGDD